MNSSSPSFRVSFLDLPLRHSRHIEEYSKELVNQISSSDFILGTGTQRFEDSIREILGQDFLTCGNCTDALFISLKFIFSRLPPHKREVIISPMSYLATVSTVILAGGVPHFVDVDDSLNIDPLKLVEALSKNTAAIMVVHLGGIPADMEAITRFATDNGLEVIEDCAQAFSSMIGNKPVGTFGLSGCFSFHPLKIFGGCGDGGGVTSKDNTFLDYAKRARNHGHNSRDDVDFFSHNMRMDSLNARFLTVQLATVESEISHRIRLRERYRRNFESFGLTNRYIKVPSVRNSARVSYNFAMFRFSKRDSLKQFLEVQGIETRIHYPNLLSNLKPFRENHAQKILSDLQFAEKAVNEILSLPCASHLEENDIDTISVKIAEFYELDLG